MLLYRGTSLVTILVKASDSNSLSIVCLGALYLKMTKYPLQMTLIQPAWTLHPM